MDRVAVFVDAGHLFAAGSLLLAGKVLKRGELLLHHEEVVAFLIRRARELTGLPLLRIYWYDGTSAGPTPAQLALAYRPEVKLRLGLVNLFGQQKGVDSLIVTDLINLSRNRAMASAVLVAADEDLRVGVMQAQEYGVRVHLLPVTPAKTQVGSSGISALLRQEADGCDHISKEQLTPLLTIQEAAVAPPSTPPVTAGVVDPAPAVVAVITVAPVAPQPIVVSEAPLSSLPADGELGGPTAEPSSPASRVVAILMGELRPDEILLVTQGSPRNLPNPVDRQLLAVASKHLGLRPLPDELRREIRTLLHKTCCRSVGLTS